MNTEGTRKAAREALEAYAPERSRGSAVDPDHIVDLIADLFHVAAHAGHDVGGLLDRARRHVTAEAEASEAAHIIRVVVTARVVSYAGCMDAASVREALRIGSEALALNVEDEETTERIMPWVRVEEVTTAEAHRAYDL